MLSNEEVKDKADGSSSITTVLLIIFVVMAALFASYLYYRYR